MALRHDDAHAMTVKDFLAFTETRPDGERWELIDGEPLLNPSPSFGHQRLVGVLVARLLDAEKGTLWQVLPGIGARLSEIDMPIPDVMIRPRGWIESHYCDDMIAAFEVLSPSSVRRDLVRKRQFYEMLPSCRHYVVLAQDRIDVRCYDRASGWIERRLTEADARLDLDDLDVSLDLARLYRDALA